MQIRHRITHALSLSLASMLPCSTLADAPRVLDIVPRATAAVIAVSSLKELDGHVSELLGAMEARTLGSLSLALVAMGLRDGLDLEGSAAGLLYEPVAPPKEGEPVAAPPRVLLLLPVSDADKFLATLQAKADPDLWRFDYAGVGYFARRIGDAHLALSSEQDLVRNFTAMPGSLEQHKAAIGARGREVLERAPIIALGDPDALRAAFEPIIESLTTGAPMPGAGDADLLRDSRSSIPGRMLRVAMDEASSVIVGIDPGALGLRIDAAAVFPDDAIMSRICRGDAEDPQPFRLLPKLPYLFAGAIDTAHPGVRLMLDEFGPGPGSIGPQAEAERAIITAASDMRTATVAIYDPPSVMFGALTRMLIAWDAKSPRDAAVLFQKWLDVLAKEESGVNATKTVYTTGARTLEDLRIDEWSIEPPAGSMPMLPMLFGPVPGPQGFFAATDRFGYLQPSRQDALMTAALKTAKQGVEASLQSDMMLSQVSDLLPRPRAIEGYIDVRPLLKQARALMGEQAPLPHDIPDELPPVGMAIVMSDGSLQAAAFIPAPLLRIGYFAWRESDRAPETPDAGDPPRSGAKPTPRRAPRHGASR